MVESQQIQLPDWQLYIAAVADDILREQSPKALLALRGKLYELLSNCIPPELIMKHLVGHLLKTAVRGDASRTPRTAKRTAHASSSSPPAPPALYSPAGRR